MTDCKEQGTGKTFYPIVPFNCILRAEQREQNRVKGYILFSIQHILHDQIYSTSREHIKLRFTYSGIICNFLIQDQLRALIIIFLIWICIQSLDQFSSAWQIQILISNLCLMQFYLISSKSYKNIRCHIQIQCLKNFEKEDFSLCTL